MLQDINAKIDVSLHLTNSQDTIDRNETTIMVSAPATDDERQAGRNARNEPVSDDELGRGEDD